MRACSRGLPPVIVNPVAGACGGSVLLLHFVCRRKRRLCRRQCGGAVRVRRLRAVCGRASFRMPAMLMSIDWSPVAESGTIWGPPSLDRGRIGQACWEVTDPRSKDGKLLIKLVPCGDCPKMTATTCGARGGHVGGGARSATCYHQELF